MRIPAIFPTSVVGSFPRPSWLVKAIEDRASGRLDPSEFEDLLDDSVKVTIKEQEVIGIDVISDGEQRRFSFFYAELFKGMEYRPIYSLASLRGSDAIQYLRSIGMPEGVRHPVTIGDLDIDEEFLKREAGFALRYSRDWGYCWRYRGASIYRGC